jgi:hypothetical protein
VTKIFALGIVLLFVGWVIQTFVGARTITVESTHTRTTNYVDPIDCAPPPPEPGGDDCKVPDPTYDVAPTPPPKAPT